MKVSVLVYIIWTHLRTINNVHISVLAPHLKENVFPFTPELFGNVSVEGPSVYQDFI